MSRPPIEGELLSRGHRFNFFQAVRLIERLGRGRRPVGHDDPPETEAVRFRPHLSLGFPPAAIHAIDQVSTDGPAQMEVNHFGLYGPQGALPRFYTELLCSEPRQRRESDSPFRRFLDVINHRLSALLFRAGEKYRYASAWRPSGADPISTSLLALAGRTPSHAGEDRVPDRCDLLRYVGLFTQRPRSAATLAGLLADRFEGVRFEVEQFVPRWLTVPQESQAHLSASHRTNQLGRSFLLGGSVRSCTARLRVGPLDRRTFEAFLPEGELFAVLCPLVREFVGDHVAFEVMPILAAGAVPPLALGGAESAGVARLGRTSWLTPHPNAPAHGGSFRAPRGSAIPVGGPSG